MSQFVGFGLAFILTVCLVPAVRYWAVKFQIVDNPSIDPERRVHDNPIPLLGGVAIWCSIVVMLIWYAFFKTELVSAYINAKAILGIIIGGSILMIGGYIDDRYKLTTFWKVVLPFIAAIVVIASGIGVNFITNPFGGVWRIDQLKIELFTVNGVSYFFNVWADLFTLFWLVGLVYTTKLLDGLDGLVTGVTSIGAGIVVFLCLMAPVLQPDTALLAAIIGGAFLGFLPYNWSPASIFLGDGGSLLSGFLLGCLAIIAGGKIATTILILGVPAIDVVWVMTRRVVFEHRWPIMPDRKHLHFRLLDIGLSKRQAVLIIYLVIFAFGVSALFMQSQQKLFALLLLIVLVVIGGFLLVLLEKKNR